MDHPAVPARQPIEELTDDALDEYIRNGRAQVAAAAAAVEEALRLTEHSVERARRSLSAAAPDNARYVRLTLDELDGGVQQLVATDVYTADGAHLGLLCELADPRLLDDVIAAEVLIADLWGAGVNAIDLENGEPLPQLPSNCE